MTIIPVLLDSSLPFMSGSASSASLLLLPAGTRPLVAEVAEQVAAVTAAAPIVLPTFVGDAEYERRIGEALPTVDEIVPARSFRERLHRFDPSDVLLFVAPTSYPAERLDLRGLVVTGTSDSSMVRHLLAFERTSLHTKELVHAGEDGRVRRIQRYFEPVTWPFPAGVIASLVPAACLQRSRESLPTALADLRQALLESGAPSLDVPFHGHFFDLADEAGALAFCERHVVAAASASRSARARRADHDSALVVARGAEVHESARVLGAVVVLEGAVVEAGALVIGPTLLAAGARVGANAVVAQCLVASGAIVPAGATVRHRVVPAAQLHAARAVSALSAAGPALHHRLTPSTMTSPTARGQRRQLALPAPQAAAASGRARRRLAYCAVKGIVEPMLAVVALALLAPLFALIMLCVLVTSGRPIFYGDVREGKDGNPFRCWKFRSMRTNAHLLQKKLADQQEMDGPQFKMAGDPRVTPVGRWLRRLNVDELPQLVNVICGEMSFVGPRPSPFRENQICVPWRRGRLSVRPGITGLWQVCRHDRVNGDFHQWIYYDLLYVRHFSLLVDVKIFAATILSGAGRYPVPVEVILGVPKPARRTAAAVPSRAPRVARTARQAV